MSSRSGGGGVPWDVPRRLTPPLDGGRGSARANAVGRSAGISMPDGTGVSGGSIVELSIYAGPVPGTRPINRSAVVTGLTAAGSPSIPADLQLQLQGGELGVIRSLTLNINDMLQTTNVRFDLLFDGAPVDGWSDLRIFPRVAASVSATYEPAVTMVLVPEGSQVSVRIRVIDGGTYQVGASYTGWRYSTSLAARYGLAGVV